MTNSFQLDGNTHAAADLTPAGQDLLARLAFVQSRITEIRDQHAMLSVAKDTTITALKAEIIQHKSGVDLSKLYDPED